MTAKTHGTSTERVHEVAEKIRADFYVVVNGDEPLISPMVIEKILPEIEITSDFYVANLQNNKESEICAPVSVLFSAYMGCYAGNGWETGGILIGTVFMFGNTIRHFVIHQM